MAISNTQIPGVYSTLDASRTVASGRGGKTIGIVAVADTMHETKKYAILSYADALTLFGGQEASAKLLKMIGVAFQNGAGSVIAACVKSAATDTQYDAAFSLLDTEEAIFAIVCDSDLTTVITKMKEHINSASAERKERIGVAALSAATSTAAVTAAKSVNDKRMVCLYPAATDGAAAMAAAFAGALAGGSDPALPINGAELLGLSGLNSKLTTTEANALITGGVTPIQTESGRISVMRAVTSKTTENSLPDYTWQELTTVLIGDDVIRTIRNELATKFRRTKNTVQKRAAIKSEIITLLDIKVVNEIIDSYTDPTVSQNIAEPTICNVDFGFDVADPLNQIHISAHMTI